MATGLGCDGEDLAKAQVETEYAEVSVCVTVGKEIDVFVSRGECDSSLLSEEHPSNRPVFDPEDLIPSCVRVEIDEPSVHVDPSCIE